MTDNRDGAVVRLSHGRKAFGDTEVLRDISLEVNSGDVLAVIGPSGGGKSTLLRCLTLLERLDDGSLAYGDLEVARGEGGRAVYARAPELKAARERFGLVFQNFNLFPHRTVLQNVADAPQVVKGVPRGEAEARARELLAQMDLAGKEDLVPCELSGGQQQRVAIARAIAAKPGLLLLDEPTSALDPEYTTEVLDVIQELKEDGLHFIIVTHEMGFARHACDKAAFLCGVSLIEYGESAQLFGQPETEQLQRFLGKLLEWNL